MRRLVVCEDPDPKRDLGDDPKPIRRPRFNHPKSYVFRTCSWLERFGVLPEPGGLNDQSSIWVRDAELYFAMKAQVQREYEVWKSEQGRRS